MSDRLTRLIAQLDQRFNITMTEYMRPDESSTDPDPWEEVPFSQIYKAVDVSESKDELIRTNAEKIHAKVTKDGRISSDEAVEPAMATMSNVPQESAAFYYRYCGPVAATADDVEWRTAFRLDLDDALECKSEAWKAKASEFSIRDSRQYDLVPDAIASYYGALEEATRRNDCERYMHPEEFYTVGPQITQSARLHALDHLEKFPGVIPPEEDGPAWELVEQDEPEATAASTPS